jgi:hypothetical protein
MTLFMCVAMSVALQKNKQDWAKACRRVCWPHGEGTETRDGTQSTYLQLVKTRDDFNLLTGHRKSLELHPDGVDVDGKVGTLQQAHMTPKQRAHTQFSLSHKRGKGRERERSGGGERSEARSRDGSGGDISNYVPARADRTCGGCGMPEWARALSPRSRARQTECRAQRRSALPTRPPARAPLGSAAIVRAVATALCLVPRPPTAATLCGIVAAATFQSLPKSPPTRVNARGPS